MARKLKTYTTSAGFFDLAVAAPSMKAALEAWGSKNNLFQHGFAKVSEDPKIVAATMAHPGVVLRRPVGSNGAFSEHAELPTDLPVGKPKQAPAKRSAKKREPPTEGSRRQDGPRGRARVREGAEAARQRAPPGRGQRGDKNASAASGPSQQPKQPLNKPGRTTRQELEDIEKDRAALDKRSQAEDARWRKKKEELEAELRKARSGSHLRLV